MTRDQRLRGDARETARRRGHDLSRFYYPATAMSLTGKTMHGRSAYCRNPGCRAHASVIPDYLYEIFGEAVAVNCPYPPEEIR